mmetsp:Transcript_12423/g.27315  ORF Transcript_12423/g.27315 Transcript_12423/m.27315 type:complete len:145 (-) Transcript_12423:891-1325(-)
MLFLPLILWWSSAYPPATLSFDTATISSRALRRSSARNDVPRPSSTSLSAAPSSGGGGNLRRILLAVTAIPFMMYDTELHPLIRRCRPGLGGLRQRRLRPGFPAGAGEQRPGCFPRSGGVSAGHNGLRVGRRESGFVAVVGRGG